MLQSALQAADRHLTSAPTKQKPKRCNSLSFAAALRDHLMVHDSFTCRLPVPIRYVQKGVPGKSLWDRLLGLFVVHIPNPRREAVSIRITPKDTLRLAVSHDNPRQVQAGITCVQAIYRRERFRNLVLNLLLVCCFLQFSHDFALDLGFRARQQGRF